jgi:hypothetical protein
MEARAPLKPKGMLDTVDVHPHLIPRSLCLGRKIPIGGSAHQAGTMHFGTDLAASVLSLDCRAPSSRPDGHGALRNGTCGSF